MRELSLKRENGHRQIDTTRIRYGEGAGPYGTGIGRRGGAALMGKGREGRERRLPGILAYQRDRIRRNEKLQ